MTLTALKSAAVLAAALSLAGCQQQSDEAFGQRVRAYLLEHPEVLQEVSVALQQKQQAELAKASSDAIEKHRAQLERDPRDFVANPDGKITVVEFFDYNCAYCKIAAPEVVKLIQENPDVRFVFKEFAFQTPDSIEAAHIALTPQAKAKGLELHRLLMAQKPLNQAAIDRSLREAGVDPAAARAAAKDPAIERQLLDVRALAQALHIDGTPAFVVGDKVIPGADIEALRAAIAAAKATDLKRPSGNPS
ncbi:protein-disulfide isomerase [Phenylobacterium zucineum HLK1]|uniref:Protein-disulfide isomerase n=1 Tax=Phenylobacterium zucineum (strain HLK1) TaxID=450851 RepID=B4RCR8_PHEZH|nr:DsbA family protein [Phenylobacterium zucineum]ACG78255.1 protein-disulfide isomerase [Phenylobacterium zucineum HLK1]